jgi:hypothetical protein
MSLSRDSAIPAYPRWPLHLSVNEHNPAILVRLDANLVRPRRDGAVLAGPRDSPSLGRYLD